MGTQYFCKSRDRMRRLKDDSGLPVLNGIDYIEVDDAQTTLTVYFIYRLPGTTGSGSVPAYTLAALQKGNIRISGGVRIPSVKVKTCNAGKNVLTVTVVNPGDFSIYTLSIVNSPTDPGAPEGFDSQLSSIDFSFKINCPNDFDCKQTLKCPPERLAEPGIDYLAKDYSSFLTLMFDRLSVVTPGWKERHPADQQVMMVELLAYLGDQLSYYQDAVATEAYLGTARSRVSLRRHARMLDYMVHDGCNARTWIHVHVDRDIPALPKGTVMMTKGAAVPSSPLQHGTGASVAFFETMHDIDLYAANNSIDLYTWGNTECCLPKGATHATLLSDAALPLQLKVNDVLIFEEISSPTVDSASDADPTHRHAVRLTRVKPAHDDLYNLDLLEIDWDDTDKLPFPVCISVAGDKTGPRVISVARGNIVLADHGLTQSGYSLVPDTYDGTGLYRPVLDQTGISVAVAYDHDTDQARPAVDTLLQDPHEALPVISLFTDHESWSVSRDLLASDRFATEFVAEIEDDGLVRLRFGDDIMGRKPEAGFHPLATCRLGNGASGNAGADTICQTASSAPGIISVRNPLPAKGGRDPETMDQIREFAPQAFRRQERAVIEADYAEKAQLHPRVQKAAATFRWTGSWYTVFLYIDRMDGLEVDDDFKAEMCLFMEKYRMAGYDLEIKGPRYVPLDILLTVCVKPGYFRSDVRENLLNAFSRYDLPDGTRGFFHPDNFTFGQPVYLSAIYQCALQVPGVASVEIQRFQRYGKKPAGELKDEWLKAGDLEIVRLDNDPNFPENGKMDFTMYGGL